MRALFCAALVFALPLAANAAPSPGQDHTHTIVMTGEGFVSATPDQSVVSAGVVTLDRTADRAVAGNRDTMNNAFDALKKMGIPEQAIQTVGFHLEPEYPPEDPKNPQPREIIAYEVSNEINVKLDDVTRAGAVLDALIAAGANRSAGVSFSIKNPKPLLTQARTDAAKDAMDRAQTYARAVGATLGPVLSITEGYPTISGGGVETVVVTGSRATPIEAGEQTVSASVTITWAVK